MRSENSHQTYQESLKPNHKKTGKSNPMQVQKKLKELLTMKSSTHSMRCFKHCKLGKNRRYYYHDHKYSDPWNSDKDLENRDWGQEIHKVSSLRKKDPGCLNFLIKIGRKYSLLTETKLPQKLEVGNDAICENNKKLYQEKKVKQRTILFQNQLSAESFIFKHMYS